MAQSPIDPSINFVAITTSDTVGIAYNGRPARTKGVYVGVTGNIVFINDLGDAVTFIGAVAGSVLPISTERINATSTTATDLVALF